MKKVFIAVAALVLAVASAVSPPVNPYARPVYPAAPGSTYEAPAPVYAPAPAYKPEVSFPIILFTV